MNPTRLLFAVGLIASRAVFAGDVRSSYEAARHSVVLLKTFDRLGSELAQGTGFLVSGDLVVTNHHVIEDASRVEASGQALKSVAVIELLAQDPKQDLAVLRLPQTALHPLSLALRPVSIGESVVVVGNPLGLADTLSEGIVSAVRPHGTAGPDNPDPEHSGPLVQITAPISPGSSGSPVLDSTGHVLGVAVSSYSGGQSLNFAVPAQSVALLLRVAAKGKPIKVYSSTRRLLLQNALISFAVFALIGGILWRTRHRESPPNMPLQPTGTRPPRRFAPGGRRASR